MTVCAVLLVKNEADIIGHTLGHLLNHVDDVIVQDNGSTDGTSEIIQTFPVTYQYDPEVAHYQSVKMTALALQAFELGHRWVLPVDADEIWYAPEGRMIRDWLDGNGREIQFVKAQLYNHVATAKDDPETLDPVRRIGYRQRTPLDMRWGKVACRCRPDLWIDNGNHSARTQGVGTTAYGLEIRHFPYRSPEQFVAKALNGYEGLKAATLEDEGTGAHTRAYGQAIEEGGVEAGYAWFMDAFFSQDPDGDDSLIYDAAPGAWDA